MHETIGGHEVGTRAAFGAAVLLGGGNFLAVRFSNSELDPFWGAGLRFSIAGVLFLAVCAWWRLPWPRGRRLIETAAYGFLNFALFYALMYWALVRVTAGMATVVLAMVPLITVILAAAQRLERLSRRAILGSLLALVGIVGMSVSPAGFETPPSGLLAMVLAACCVGQSVILGKRISGNHPAMTNAVALLTGAPVLLMISSLAGEQWALPRAPEAIWAVAYLVTLGSVGLFVLVILVVRRWTASATAYMFVLFPVVTMLFEAWLADVPLTVRGMTGAVTVIAAVWFGALAPERGLSRGTPQEAPAGAPSR
jgi:drug/metabolite transporter (DMT)-like permease